jgi:hypothetical protein
MVQVNGLYSRLQEHSRVNLPHDPKKWEIKVRYFTNVVHDSFSRPVSYLYGRYFTIPLSRKETEAWPPRSSDPLDFFLRLKQLVYSVEINRYT